MCREDSRMHPWVEKGLPKLLSTVLQKWGEEAMGVHACRSRKMKDVLE